MAIYVKREAAVKDTIQTPDDIGVDLDQIEKNIAGVDGIEAHKEEIEDAELGLIDDAELAESAAMIMYESQYNLNQIFECLAIHELEAASIDRELVLEEADTEGFIQMIIRNISEAAEKFGRWFMDTLTKIVAYFTSNKKFASQYKDAIESGYDKVNTEGKGMKYDDNYISSLTNTIKSFSGATIKELDREMSSDEGNDIEDFFNKRVYSKILGEDVESDKDLRAKIMNKACTEAASIKEVYSSAADLIKVLNNDTSRDIKAVYNSTKESVNESIKNIKNDVRKNDDKEIKEQLKTIAKVATNWQNAVQSAAMTLATIRLKEAAQARRFAMKCVAASGKKVEDIPAEPTVDTPKTESTISSNDVFGSIKLI